MARKHGVPDAENPEWTDEMFQNAKPGSAVFSEAFLAEASKERRGRGPQKAPTKQLVSLRVDQDVLEAYRSTGKGWQGRMNQTLADHAPSRRRKRSKKVSASRRRARA